MRQKKKTSASQISKTDKILIENFVALQKVMVDLSSNFEILNKKITSLLTLFEDSAKSLVKRDLDFGKKDDEEALKKLNAILEQNKLIAKGLTLMHDTNLSSRVSHSSGNSELNFKKTKIIEEPHDVKESFSKNSFKEEFPFKVPQVPGNKPFSGK